LSLPISLSLTLIANLHELSVLSLGRVTLLFRALGLVPKVNLLLDSSNCLLVELVVLKDCDGNMLVF
jgi:hypothetical protein